MNRSTRPRNTADLSKSLSDQINMYALAASAAGVSVLASARPAQGKVIYTPTHHVIRLGSKYDLDLNHDGKKDFTIYDFSCALTSRCVTAGALSESNP